MKFNINNKVFQYYSHLAGNLIIQLRQKLLLIVFAFFSICAVSAAEKSPEDLAVEKYLSQKSKSEDFSTTSVPSSENKSSSAPPQQQKSTVDNHTPVPISPANTTVNSTKKFEAENKNSSVESAPLPITRQSGLASSKEVGLYVKRAKLECERGSISHFQNCDCLAEQYRSNVASLDHNGRIILAADSGIKNGFSLECWSVDNLKEYQYNFMRNDAYLATTIPPNMTKENYYECVASKASLKPTLKQFGLINPEYYPRQQLNYGMTECRKR